MPTPYLKKVSRGFPGSAVVENLPANAGDTGSSPGLRRSHMPQSNWAREPHLLSLRVWSLCSATGGAAIVRGPHTVMKSGPHLPQLEKALTQKRRHNTAKKKKQFLIINPFTQYGHGMDSKSPFAFTKELQKSCDFSECHIVKKKNEEDLKN